MSTLTQAYISHSPMMARQSPAKSWQTFKWAKVENFLSTPIWCMNFCHTQPRLQTQFHLTKQRGFSPFLQMRKMELMDKSVLPLQTDIMPKINMWRAQMMLRFTLTWLWQMAKAAKHLSAWRRFRILKSMHKTQIS